MMLATPPDGSVILATLRDVSGPAIWQCLACDEPDPLKSERVEGWIKPAAASDMILQPGIERPAEWLI